MHGQFFFVSDIQAALQFYVDMLGFRKKWDADEGTVCQVNRGGCEIILCQNQTRHDKARLFVELRCEISERNAPNEKTWWGYDTIQIVDPDGKGE